MIKKSRIISIILVLVLLVLLLANKNEVMEFLKNKFVKENYQIEYSEYVDKASEEFSVSKSLIYAVIYTESKFNPEAVSRVGAKGLMQLMPETYSWIASRLGEKADESMIFDPCTNIRYGTYYLSFLLERFEDEKCVYASYNAGYGRVTGWLSDSRYSSDGKKLDLIPYAETSSYVEKVEKAKKEYEEILSKNKTI